MGRNPSTLHVRESKNRFSGFFMGIFGVFGVFLKPGYYQYGVVGLVLEDIVFSSPLCKNKILLEVGDPSSDTGWTSKIFTGSKNCQNSILVWLVYADHDQYPRNGLSFLKRVLLGLQ